MSRKSSFKSESNRELPPPPPSIRDRDRESRDDEEETDSEYDKDRTCMETMKRRAGRIGVIVFFFAVIFITIGLTTPYWLQSDRIEGNSARFERLGLWTHCLRSLADPFDPYVRRYTAGCKVFLGLFSSEALEKRIPGLPAFFVAVQFLYTICFLLMFVAMILVIIRLVMTCSNPDRKRIIILLTKYTGHITIIAAFLGLIAIVIFGAKGNEDNHPDLQNSYNNLSWSYAFAVVGVILLAISGLFFGYEGYLKNRRG